MRPRIWPTSLVPPPPDTFSLATTTITAHTELWRIHGDRYGPTQFNPGRGGSRFAPIQQEDGSPVPTAYAATDFDTAVFETILHDVDPAAPFKTYTLSTLDTLRCTVLRPGVDLALTPLFTPDLMRMNVGRGQLIDTPAREYPRTRLWSQALYAAVPNAQGLIWTSRARPEGRALMLFGDRLPASALRVVLSVALASEPTLLTRFRDLAESAGIVLSA